jgi:diaminohydroxyphosphoribosylaminopyrimidine deaminase / 5-amino-6-(5-phosphoribosylamino)uracil reductase
VSDRKVIEGVAMAEPAAGHGAPPAQPGADREWLAAAIRLSERCPPSEAAFSVGALLVGASGQVFATGYSRETGPGDHAEEIALRRAVGAELAGATLYSSLEPCLRRKSRPAPCAKLISAAGVRRVVIAWREPPLFVQGGGAFWLASRGITVVELPELAPAAMAVNKHLLSR